MSELKFVCSICGKEHKELDAYLKCVSDCGKQIKKTEAEAEEKKYLKEMNDALEDVKRTKAHYEWKLMKFKEKYPKEYALNFGEDDVCCDTCNCEECSDSTNKEKETYMFYNPFNSSKKPLFYANLNGEKFDDMESFLEAYPETKNLARLLGVL